MVICPALPDLFIFNYGPHPGAEAWVGPWTQAAPAPHPCEQRLGAARVLIHEPQVLILDEPASGLDPLSRRDLRRTLQRLAKDGATVIVSSHILSELAEMCSLLCIMNEGQLLASGTADEVRRELGRSERQLSVTPLCEIETVVAWREWASAGGLQPWEPAELPPPPAVPTEEPERGAALTPAAPAVPEPAANGPD